VSRGDSIRAGLAVSPRVTVPDERYSHVVRVFHRAGLAWQLSSRPLLDAQITRTLGTLEDSMSFNYSADAPEVKAVHHAYENAAAFARWARRHPDKIARILAEAAGRPLGSVETLTP